MFRRNFLSITSAALLASTSIAFAGGHSKDIVDTAVGAGSFTTLVAAVQAAGLVDTLKGEGPFTVFAPLNDSFAALPAGTVETSLMTENMCQLTDVLTYHVVSGAVMSTDLAAGSTLVGTVMTDASICVTSDMGVTIADGTGEMATVVIADIEASNGVIHVIDKVLLPGTAPVCE